jgi:hypothetical protein
VMLPGPGLKVGPSGESWVAVFLPLLYMSWLGRVIFYC